MYFCQLWAKSFVFNILVTGEYDIWQSFVLHVAPETTTLLVASSKSPYLGRLQAKQTTHFIESSSTITLHMLLWQNLDKSRVLPFGRGSFQMR